MEKTKKAWTLLILALFAVSLSSCTLWNSSSGTSSVAASDGEQLFFGGKFTDEVKAASYFKRNGTLESDGSYKVGGSYDWIAYQPSDSTYCLNQKTTFKSGSGIFTQTDIWSIQIPFKLNVSLKKISFYGSYVINYSGRTDYTQVLSFQITGFQTCSSIAGAHYSVVSIENNWEGDIDTEDEIATSLYNKLTETLKYGEELVQKIDTSFTLW